MSMDEQATVTSVRYDAWVQCVETAWKLPFNLSAGLWEAMCMAVAQSTDAPHEDAEGQLVVPDPIEEEGERALFA